VYPRMEWEQQYVGKNCEIKKQKRVSCI
jgi:hypothetical protein